MSLFPRATKSRMVKMLRSKGADIPSLYKADFSKCGYSFWLRWRDKAGAIHNAYYSSAAGRPVLKIDENWVPITLVEVIHFDLIEEK